MHTGDLKFSLGQKDRNQKKQTDWNRCQLQDGITGAVDRNCRGKQQKIKTGQYAVRANLPVSKFLHYALPPDWFDYHTYNNAADRNNRDIPVAPVCRTSCKGKCGFIRDV